MAVNNEYERFFVEMVDPDDLVIRSTGIREDKVERFGKKSRTGTLPPPYCSL